MQLLIEAFVVGILLLIVAIPVMGIQHKYYPDVPGESNKNSNKTKYYVSTIIIGMLVHFLCEFTGINKYYCDKGYACQTN